MAATPGMVGTYHTDPVLTAAERAADEPAPKSKAKAKAKPAPKGKAQTDTDAAPDK